MNNNLKQLREQIDEIDREILQSLKKRVEVVKQIGILKKEAGVPPLDEKRWNEVLESKLVLARELGLSPNVIKKIYETLHEYSLKIERK